MRILIMGLPGSGKTTLALALVEKLDPDVLWLNADKLRELYSDWDFSYEGRMRQAARMKTFADCSEDKFIIADFVCPLPEMRDIFSPDVIIWVDTIPSGRFEDTNKVFTPPEKYDFRVDSQNADYWAAHISSCIKGHSTR